MQVFGYLGNRGERNEKEWTEEGGQTSWWCETQREQGLPSGNANSSVPLVHDERQGVGASLANVLRKLGQAQQDGSKEEAGDQGDSRGRVVSDKAVHAWHPDDDDHDGKLQWSQG